MIDQRAPAPVCGAHPTRVLRGGSWNNDARNARAAYRNHNRLDNLNDNNGFRLAVAPARDDSAGPASKLAHASAMASAAIPR